MVGFRVRHVGTRNTFRDAGKPLLRHHVQVQQELDRLTALIERQGVIVVSGAGMSTDSGIPDYRGPSGAALRRHAPMTFQSFTRDSEARHRYWARSHVGWPMMRDALPNSAHRAVAALEGDGALCGVITQNVDGLHGAAGSRRVVDLHGRLDQVICLDCRDVTPRNDLARRLDDANPGWRYRPGVTNPDGDVELSDDDIHGFVMVPCERCGGVLKPDVVYFGENVPNARVTTAYAMVEEADALLVLGSSLHVYSGRRFVTRARERGLPIAIVNQGPTKGDDLADIRIDAPLGDVLPQLINGMAGASAGGSVQRQARG